MLSKWLSGKEFACQCRRCGFDPSLGWEDSLEKEMATHPSILAWNTIERGAWWLAPGYSPWGHKELDMTECLNKTVMRTVV